MKIILYSIYECLSILRYLNIHCSIMKLLFSLLICHDSPLVYHVIEIRRQSSTQHHGTHCYQSYGQPIPDAI